MRKVGGSVPCVDCRTAVASARSFALCEACDEKRRVTRCCGCGAVCEPSDDVVNTHDDTRRVWHRSCLSRFHPTSPLLSAAPTDPLCSPKKGPRRVSLTSPARGVGGASAGGLVGLRAHVPWWQAVDTDPNTSFLFHETPPPDPSTPRPRAGAAGSAEGTPPGRGAGAGAGAGAGGSESALPQSVPQVATPGASGGAAAGAGAGGAPRRGHGKRATHRRRHKARRQGGGPAAAAPPGDAAASKRFYSVNLEDLLSRVRVMGLVRERAYRFKSYPPCVVARELVDFLVSTRQCMTRGEGVELGKLLVDRGYMRHVVDDHDFSDDMLFFKLTPPEAVPRPMALPPPAQGGPQQAPLARTLASAIVQEEYFDKPRGRAGSGVPGVPGSSPPEFSTPGAGSVAGDSPGARQRAATSGDAGAQHPSAAAAAADTRRRSALPGRAQSPLSQHTSGASPGTSLPGAAAAAPPPPVPAVPAVKPVARVAPSLTRGMSTPSISSASGRRGPRTLRSGSMTAMLTPQQRLERLELRAVKAGFLTKQGHKVKNWKRRWFVLRGRTLQYFRKPSDTTAAGTIDILDFDLEKAADSKTPLRMRLLSRRSDDVYAIEADSPRDFVDWVKAITQTASEFRAALDLIDAARGSAAV